MAWAPPEASAPARSWSPPEVSSGDMTTPSEDDTPGEAERKAEIAGGDVLGSLARGAAGQVYGGLAMGGHAITNALGITSGDPLDTARAAAASVPSEPLTEGGRAGVDALNRGMAAADRPIELAEDYLDPSGNLKATAQDVAERGNYVAAVAQTAAPFMRVAAATEAAKAPVATAPAKAAGFTREEFAPRPPKPKIMPKAGESAQAAAARQGIPAAAPEPTAAPATPSAAPGAKGTPAPKATNDPSFFEAPDNQDLKSGTAGPEEQAHRQAAVERGAPTLPQVRESAITNSYEDQGRDWTGKQAGDKTAVAQIAAEGQALHSEAGRISQETGGQQGTGESADRIRGQSYQDWHDSTVEALDNHIKATYAEEDAAAKQIASPGSNLKGVLTDDSLIDNANAGAVRSSTIALGKKMGVDLTDPNAQLNGYQIENLRKHANSIYGSAPRLAQALKNAADADLPPGAYVRARKLQQLKSDLFDNRDGINRLGPSKDIDPATGRPRPENRPVKAPDVMKTIEGMDPEQVSHIVRTMKRSSSVLEALGDHDAAMAITDKAHKAAQQLQSHFTERWVEEAGKGGGWNQRRADQYLRGNQETLASIFSPEQMHQIRNVHNAANVLDLDKRYKGAFAQFASGAGWARRLAGTLGVGGARAALAKLTMGASVGIEEGANVLSGGRIDRALADIQTGGKSAPKSFTRPLGQRMPKQGGWIGNMPEMSDFKNAENVTQETPHEHFVDENGDHNFTTAGGKSWLKAEPQDNGGLRVRASHTVQSEQGQGHGGVLYQKAAEHATSNGGRFDSDALVSKDAARRWAELARNGWDVKKDPNAKPTSSGGYTNEGDQPVFSTAGRRPAPGYPKTASEAAEHIRGQEGELGRAGSPVNLAGKFPGQRGGPKFTPKEKPAEAGYQAPKELEDFIRKSAPAHRVDPNGPANWEELQARRGEKVMPINPQGGEGSIYSDTPTNMAFRAWHDSLHLKLNAGFDHEGELKVAQEHQRQAEAAGLSHDARRALWADTWDTFKHHEDTGEFPSKPREFVAEQMKKQFPGDQPAKVNIGLHQGTEGQPGFRKMSKQEAVKALESQGLKVGKTSVVKSNTEPTLVADVHRPLSNDEMQNVLTKTKQSSIPQQMSNGEGQMHVAPGQEKAAAEQGWDKYNPDYFREHNGKTATENAKSASVAQHLTPEEQHQVRGKAIDNVVKAFHEDLPQHFTHELAAMALEGAAKRGWYKQAGNAISAFHGPDAPRFTAVLASQSPRLPVGRNFTNAMHLWDAWDRAGRPTDHAAIVKMLRDDPNVPKAVFLHSRMKNTLEALTHPDPANLVLSGPKVNSFHKNLMGNVHESTNDGWMAAAGAIDAAKFGGSKNLLGPGKSATYLGYSAHVRAAAQKVTQLMKEHGINDKWTPDEIQETVWSWFKTALEHSTKTGESVQELMRRGEINDDLIRSTPDFHSLFGSPELARVVGRNPEGNARLRAAQATNTETPTNAKARAAAQRALRPHLENSVKRVEDLRQARGGNVPEEEVPF